MSARMRSPVAVIANDCIQALNTKFAATSVRAVVDR